MRRRRAARVGRVSMEASLIGFRGRSIPFNPLPLAGEDVELAGVSWLAKLGEGARIRVA
jgi:hypothetical protein